MCISNYPKDIFKFRHFNIKRMICLFGLGFFWVENHYVLLSKITNGISVVRGQHSYKDFMNQS